MKKLVVSFLTLTLGLAAGSVVFAAGIDGAEIQQKGTWELGTEISYIAYKEPGVMEEKGTMYGLSGAYTYRGKYMLRTEGRFSFGQVDYKNSGTLDDIDDHMWEFRGLAGYDFLISETSTLTPYIGIGYRYLNDDMSGMTSSTGALGYERESNYFYSPIGVEITAPSRNGWTVGIIFEYDYFWKGIQKSHLSGAIASVSDLENDQKKGFGFRSSLKFQNKGENVDFVIEPFVRYWKIQKSEESDITVNGVIWGSGWEPKNNSTEIGIKFAAKF